MRKNLNTLEVQGKSHEATQRFIVLPEYKNAKTIFTYLAFKNEIDTNPLIQNAWQQKKNIVVPICQKKTKNMLLSRLDSFSELQPGTWDIPEPKMEYIRPVAPEQIDLVIIPGIAFDFNGNRLGYGGGYYDRFLPILPKHCCKVVLAYDFQIIHSVPIDKHDIPVDIIISENNIYRL